MLRVAARPLASTRRCVRRMSAAAVEALNVACEPGFLRVEWTDGTQSAYHYPWLRDHCPACFHPSTHQRQVDTVQIPLDIRPTSMIFDEDDQDLRLDWSSGPRREDGKPHVSTFSLPFLRHARYAMPEDMEAAGFDDSADQDPSLDGLLDRFHLPKGVRPWTRAALAAPAEFAAADVGSDCGFRDAMAALHRDGFLLVRDMPPTEAATRAFAERIGFVRRTFYGEMWDTKPPADAGAAAAIVDTAYTNQELKPHTDGTYWRDPPGLQLFNCVEQSSEGGATWLVDGFSVARRLAESDPAAFAFFARCSLPWHHTDDDGVEIGARGPVFALRPKDSHAARADALAGPFVVDQFRLNNDDRATVRMPARSMAQFYRHLHVLLTLTRAPDLAYEVRLRPGSLLVVNNHRVMHGRRAFAGGSRNLVGCYLARDEFESCLRRVGVMPSQRERLPLPES